MPFLEGTSLRIFLIHGMGRTAVSMLLLKRRLEEAGHQCSLFGYLVTVESFDDIVDRFVRKVGEVMAQDQAEASDDVVPFGVVSHSLGGIVTRSACGRFPPGFRRFLMLAPPNHPPAMAGWMQGNPIFHLLTQDVGRKLGQEAFYERLPIPQVKTLIIAGNIGPQADRLPPFRGRPNDGVVAVDETRLEGVPHVEVPALHTFVMNRRDVFEMARDFLVEPS